MVSSSLPGVRFLSQTFATLLQRTILSVWLLISPRKPHGCYSSASRDISQMPCCCLASHVKPFFICLTADYTQKPCVSILCHSYKPCLFLLPITRLSAAFTYFISSSLQHQFPTPHCALCDLLWRLGFGVLLLLTSSEQIFHPRLFHGFSRERPLRSLVVCWS